MPQIKQRLSQKLSTKISPQQIQAIKLLEYPAMLLETRIKQELQENPVLEQLADEEEEPTPLHEILREEETPAYKYNLPGFTRELTPGQEMLFSGRTLHEYLEEQLAFQDLSAEQRRCALYIIGNIDEDGYLRREIDSMADDMAFNMGLDVSAEELAGVLGVIQTLEPAGVGCRDLRECLSIQLEAIDQPTEAQRLAAQIVSERNFDDFSSHRFERLVERLGITQEQFRAASDEIARLNPKPGGLYDNDGNDSLPYLIPDFILDYHDGQFAISLTARNLPRLRVNRRYVRMIERMASDVSWKQDDMDRKALDFLRGKVDAANWFIEALQQRQRTLLRVMRAIVDLQHDYFVEGDASKLRPMILRDIAERIGMDMSTVSRVVSSKYVQTHFGTFPLRHFFTEAIPTDFDEDASSMEVKEIVAELVAQEDKQYPITDEMIMEALHIRGFHIARRTIAKYREALGIPIARLRKEL